MSPRFKQLVLFFLPLFLYFSMYTWNWKTGHLDRFSSLVGLDLAGWILSPGRWLQSNIDEFWNRYVYLVGVRQENEDLTARIKDLETELARTAEKAKAADRLTALLRFNPEPPWSKRGCRVIGQKLGPNAILETMLVDVGSAHGIRFNDPVISTKGVVGRIAKPGVHYSSVVLLTDLSSRVPVLTSDGRVPAILQGQGPGAFLEVKFIPRNDKVTPGEVLLTSGLGGVFPKGIPVARVVEVTPADVSLFQKVYAEPLLALRYYEELLVLSRDEVVNATSSAMAGGNSSSVVAAQPPGPEAANASASTTATTKSSNAARHAVRKKP